MSAAKTVVILGVTGRLGPALARAFAGWTVRGLSRRTPSADERVDGVHYTVGLRRDEPLLAALCDGAEVVIDALGFAEADSDALLRALAAMLRPPRHLLFVSSIAELPVRGRAPEGDGLGKRAARLRCQDGFPGLVHSLVLPRLVAGVDPGRREQPYLDGARAGGRALHAGDGRQRQTIAPVDGVAALARLLVEAPRRLPPGPVLVGPPAPVSVAEAIAALLEGAGVPARTAPHPDRSWRGPHGGGHEVVDTRTLARAFPELRWPDVLDVHRRLGAWLVANPGASRRPAPLIPLRDRRFRGRRVVDVHGRRVPAPFAVDHPAVGTLAGWLGDGFYVDLGRPCNAACLYCAVPPHADTEGFAPMERVRAQVEAGRDAGCRRAIFIGGEPTLHPGLGEALAYLREVGLGEGHVLMSNGLRLSDAGLLSSLVSAGVRTLHLSVDTADPSVYAALSRGSGSLERQHGALRNALRLRERLHTYVYTAVTAVNAASLPAHLEGVAALAREVGAPAPPLVLAFVKPIGDGLLHADRLLLGPVERAALARALVERAQTLGLQVALRNLQACLAPELAPLMVDYYLEDYALEVETLARVANPHVVEHESPVDACARCAHVGLCPGVYREELRRFGDAAYAPLGAEGLRLA